MVRHKGREGMLITINLQKELVIKFCLQMCEKASFVVIVLLFLSALKMKGCTRLFLCPNSQLQIHT